MKRSIIIFIKSKNFNKCSYPFYFITITVFLLTIYGLFSAIKLKSISFGGFHSLVIFLSVFIFVYAFLFGVRKLININNLYLIGFPLFIITLILGGIAPLVTVLYFAASSCCLGILILGALKVKAYQLTISDLFLIGAGCYGILIEFLAYFPINTTSVYSIILLLPIVFLSNEKRGDFIDLLNKLKVSLGEINLLTIFVISLALTHYVYSFLPEFGYDALAFHLYIATTMKHQASWSFNPELYSWALMPMLGDWLYSCVYILSGEVSARILNVLFILCAACIGCRFTRWMGGNADSSKWAAALILSSPLVFAESGSLFVESIWSAYILAGLFFFIRPLTPKNDEIKIGFLFLAFAVSAKAITLIWIPIFFILVGLNIKGVTWRINVKPYLIGLGFLILVGFVPYISSYLISGNPVFPFFNGVFKSPFYPEANFDNPLFKTAISWDFFYQITFNSKKYLEASAGAPGLQYLLVLPSALVLMVCQKNIKEMLVFLLSLSMIWLTFQAQSYLRYIFPAFILLSAISGLAVADVKLSPIGRRFILSSAVLSIGINLILITSAGWHYRNVPYSVFFSELARNKYIEREAPIRNAIEYINVVNKPQSPVFLLSSPYGAGLKADYLVPNWYNAKFQAQINGVSSAKKFKDLMSAYGASYIVLEANWGSAKIREFVLGATTHVYQVGSIQIRKVEDSSISDRN